MTGLIIPFTFLLQGSPAIAASGGPTAESVLNAMSVYLGGQTAFSMKADVDMEAILQDGQKLQFSGSGEALVQRPDKLRIKRRGAVTDTEILYDGKTLTLYGAKLNAYLQASVPGSIDDAILAYEHETGLTAPGADLLFADPFAVLADGVETAIYVGTAYVAGVECHHLAFREKDVDWQLWIATGDKPLPMKYIITTKWHTGAPQYQIRFTDWDLGPELTDGAFMFTPPEGAVRVEVLDIHELNDF